MLNSYFGSVFSKKRLYDPPLGKSEVQAELQFEIDKEMIKEHLISLNEFKSPGPDELHPRVIKDPAEEFSEASLRNHGRRVRCRMTGGGLTSSLSSKRAKWRNLGSTDQLV